MKKLILICITFSLVFSCNNEEDISNQESQIVDYQSFSKKLEDVLAQVSSNMRSRNIKVMDFREFKNEISNVLTVDDNFEKAFDESYDYVSALASADKRKVEKKTIYVTPYQYKVFKQIDELWYLSTSPDIYRDGLEALLAEVIASDAKVEEKNPLLTHLSSQLVAHEFIESNLDLLGIENERGREAKRGGDRDWWSDWGRCAAGIVGGAGTVGLGGFLGGAAVGTVTLPVIGTVSGALVGGVGGVIFGGISGAAAACGSGGSSGGNGCPGCDVKMECTEDNGCK